MENSNGKSAPMGSSSLKMPKNVRQIGYIGNGNRSIYVEDYVMTFMKQMAQKEHTGLKAAVLLGYYLRGEEGKSLFIRGAIEVKEVDFSSATAFSDESWTSIYENIKKYFTDVEIVGWSLAGPGFFIESDDIIRKIHTNNFQGPDKVLLKLDTMEKEETFYLHENNQLVKQTGYYIYYEKNEEMQNYMVENKEIIHEEAEYNDQTTRKIRTVIQEKKEVKEDKSVIRLMYAASTLMAIIVLVIAATMLKNYEQMHNMEAAINTLSESLGKGLQSAEKDETEATKETDALPVVNTDSEKTQDVKTGETQSDQGKETMEVETVVGNVSPTEESISNNDNAAKSTETGKTGGSTSETKAQTEAGQKATEKAATETTAASETKAQTAKNDGKTTTAQTKYYVVKAGDSLAGISFKLYNSANYIKKIMELNGIEDENKIYVGQKLIVP